VPCPVKVILTIGYVGNPFLEREQLRKMVRAEAYYIQEFEISWDGSSRVFETEKGTIQSC